MCIRDSSYVGLMHTLFTLEDNYGLKICEMDDEVCLKVDVRKNKDAARLQDVYKRQTMVILGHPKMGYLLG